MIVGCVGCKETTSGITSLVSLAIFTRIQKKRRKLLVFIKHGASNIFFFLKRQFEFGI